jgi:NADPH:quinone reductase-like Zn-dependent oxidoreductase
MKAIVQDRYGSTEVLHLRDIDKPVVKDVEVLVRVRAASVARGVWHFMTGLPYPIRFAGGLRAPKAPVPGMDMAGVIEAVGNAVTRFQPGDEVFGIGTGAFAEYACAPENRLAPKPVSLSFEQAAAVPISGLTALQGLRDHARVRLRRLSPPGTGADSEALHPTSGSLLTGPPAGPVGSKLRAADDRIACPRSPRHCRSGAGCPDATSRS